MMSHDEIYGIIPEFNLLHDRELKEKCADVWIEVLEKTEWVKRGLLYRCPISVTAVSPDCPEDALSHNRRVVRLCELVYQNLGDLFEAVGPCDHDVLIASALLHDAGKLLEFAPRDDGSFGYSPNGEMFKHPVSGAYLAQKHGLPEQVVYTVLAHSTGQSPEGSKPERTPELLILKHVDEMVFKYARLYWPRHQ